MLVLVLLDRKNGFIDGNISLTILNSLRSIVQEVNAAKDLNGALGVTVRRILEEMNTDVCSVYMLDAATERYVLMATKGLNQQAVDSTSVNLSEGLVGLVASREEPLNLDDAQHHPRFIYFPETGEERFNAFLGVPIIHQRRVLGVLVVQNILPRRFDESEEAFLVTISAQLAGVIAHAEATGGIDAMSVHDRKRELKFKGVIGCQGIAIGEAVITAPLADLEAVANHACEDIEEELDFFRSCIETVRQDIKNVGKKLSSRLNSEEQALFDVYLRMLDDGAIGGEVEKLIRSGLCAQGSLSQVILAHVAKFTMMEDDYLRERAADVKDLGLRVLAYLQDSEEGEIDYPDNTILIGEELTASILGEVPKEKLKGIISIQGSGNSHVAILARAMDIPTVMGAVDLPYTQVAKLQLVIDGYNGTIYSSPSAERLKHYQQLHEEDKVLVKELEALSGEPSITPDNHNIALWVNTGLMADVYRSLNRGAEGVGLFRTEVPFLLRERFPTEEEQRQIYREQLEAFAPKLVTMRTLDVGGDKSLSYFPIKEDNPFLGWRGIRVTLDHPEIFLAQVRAMLKASEGLGNLRIMLPMISNIPELDSALDLIHRAYEELKEEGHKIAVPPIGVMIEVPAAVYQARDIADKVDFLSVGSNDLTQYLLAVDRNNPRVADLYHSFHPAVLKALQQVVDAGHASGKSVGICGELAGDPGAALLLMAMGFDVLSMSATNLPKVKSIIRKITLKRSKELLEEVMKIDNADAIIEAIEMALEEEGLSRVFRPAIN